MTGFPDRMVRLAVLQAAATPGDVVGNAETGARLLRQAAAEGARLAVLPELFLPGYHPPALTADPAGCDLTCDPDDLVDDPRLDPIRQASRDCGAIGLIGASVRRLDGSRRCSTLLVDGATVRVAYDKQHLCGADERGLFTPGERGAAVALDSWRFGLGICYDGCFPEHARAAALAGAHGYLCPTAYVVGSAHRRDLYYAARALDNTFFVGFANLAGGDDEWRFNGGSAIYDPQGRPLRRAGDEGEAVVVADLEPRLLAETRASHAMLADSRASHAEAAGRSAEPRTLVVG